MSAGADNGEPDHGASSREAPGRARVAVAFAAVYLLWGSTYLAIHFAIRTLPPFMMAGSRFLTAGAILYAVIRLRGGAAPLLRHWRSAAIVGSLLLFIGNGGVVWAQQRVPSGVAALLVAIVPCWMVLLEWLRRGGTRPSAAVVAGLALGTTGILILVGPDALGGGRVSAVGAGALMVASFSWAVGSIYSRGAPLPASPMLATAMQMLVAGVLLTVFGAATGEAAAADLRSASLESVLGLLYLIVFGSLIGYTAYIWLLQVSTPARVSTYAYVNPVVAVLLGWLVAGEALTGRMILAAAVIVSGVALITLARAGATKGMIGSGAMARARKPRQPAASDSSARRT
jgi:drug/metabolite transporter (DMT)-like permease